LRIDENQRPAAAHDELIDGVERRVVEHRRMHDPQNVDVVVDREHALRQRPHLEQLLGLLDDDPRLRRLLGLRIEAAADRRARQQADHRLVEACEVVDQPREVVLEERLLARIGLEERNAVRRADAVRPGQAEVDGIAARADVGRLQAELLRAVFLLGERQRVDEIEHELPVGRVRRELLEHLADAGRVRAQRGQRFGRLVREEEIEVDGLVDAVEHRLRAFAERIEVVLRQIDADAAQPDVRGNGGHDERERDQHQRYDPKLVSVGAAHALSPPS
jgi:hypothetical protein